MSHEDLGGRAGDDLSIDDVLEAPLHGRRVVVTSGTQQGDKLASLLERLGADVRRVPVIEIADPPSWDEIDWAIKKLCEGFYAWVVFASSNAVDRFFDRLDAAERDARSFGRTKVAVVGAATAERLRRYGLRADLVPERATGEDLASALGRGAGRVLIPRVAGAASPWVDRIAANGWKTETVVAYVNVTPSDASPEVAAVRTEGFDVVTFASPSAVRGFVGMVGAPEDLGLTMADEGRRLVGCIGPTTAAAAVEFGFRVDVVPEEHSARGLALGLADVFRSMAT